VPGSRCGRVVACVVAALFLPASGCSPAARPNSGGASPTGTPEIRAAVVREHAAQFDDKLPDRPAGSQQELAAATYLVAHIARDGYVVRLDSVPVKNDVDSSNIEALAEGGRNPRVIVTVSYDTAPHGSPGGEALGLWLELARAWLVRAPRSRIGFVALGAEHASVDGGQLGSRRLAKVLLDAHLKPLIVSLGRIDDSGSFSAFGYEAGELDNIAHGLGMAVVRGAIAPPSARHEDVMAEAGLHHVTVAGGFEDVGRVLLHFLASPRRAHGRQGSQP
jgi:hypothetical protein